MQTERGKKIHLQCLRRRQAAKNNIVHDFTQEEWEDKVKQTNGICPMCNNKFNNNIDSVFRLTMDHIFPISKANEEFQKTGIKRIYTIIDVMPLCKSCNSSKFNTIIKPKALYTSNY